MVLSPTKKLDNPTTPSSSPLPSTPSTPIVPIHYLHELPHADEERLEKLFNQLDLDGNGRIDIHDLSVALNKFGFSHQYAEVSSV